MFGLFGSRGKNMEKAVEEAAQNPAVRLVDVRTAEEYRQGHLPGSILLPLDQLNRADQLLPDKSAPVYVYCLSGARSATACKMLGRMGYAQVSNIGGIGGYRGRLER